MPKPSLDLGRVDLEHKTILHSPPSSSRSSAAVTKVYGNFCTPTSNKLNKTLRSFTFTMLESTKTGSSDENAIAAKRSVDVYVNLGLVG
ncbi:hypothetical protein BC936DRAFT_136834 [Jimgerdemannia flammicorona]|uniref:Uncharacterized protein n=1 Tax=Jimgerdemannia flammicorona TaxID=994334 RepID=A0A433CYP4_9FUNG|nr:hypothetical protein BC936DRAFT_136834 [Jimgerdemannia flammicorona]